MKNFNRGGGFGGKKSGGGGFGRRDSGDRGVNRRGDSFGRPEMHSAVCADCGKDCEVPFRPTGDKPVFCSNCFKGKDGSSPRRSDGGDFSRPSFGDKKLFKAVCADCGQACEVPFKPSGDKPVYCSQCFGKGGNVKGGGSSKEQFEILNEKLDKILRALGSANSAEPILKKEAIKEEKNHEPRKKTFKTLNKKISVSKIKALKKSKKK